MQTLFLEWKTPNGILRKELQKITQKEFENFSKIFGKPRGKSSRLKII